MVYPLVAALVAAVFAGQLAWQYRARRRSHALAWCLSLGLFAVAAGAVAVGVGIGWSRAVFGVYWVAGALLNVPLLATGQLLLMDPRRSALWWTLAGICAAWAVLFTAMAEVDPAVLARASQARDIPLGSAAIGGQMAYTLVGSLNATFLVVVVGSLWSAVRLRRPAVGLIALGVALVAVASSFVSAGQGRVFSVLLALGVGVMYTGFLATARGRRRRPVVTIYSRQRCGLCREAEAAVARIAGRGADVLLVDIDADPALTERYTIRVPVIAVDGVEIAEYHVDAQALRAKLREARLKVV
ncbi:MAG: glutaredoxin family protein [Egibacteraceae bacterium]